MKRFIDNSEKKFQGFDILSENAMLKVRGGGGTIPPKTRDRDAYDDEQV